MKPFWATLLLVLSAPLALAEETTVDQAVGAANTSWIMTATALVLFMTLPGLALFYGGLKQAKREREGETIGFFDNLIILLDRKITVSYTHLKMPTKA